MRLLNVDSEVLRNKCVRVKNDCAAQMDKVRRGEGVDVEFGKDIITICNETLGLLDLIPGLEKAGKLLSLVKELHNLVHNI